MSFDVAVLINWLVEIAYFIQEHKSVTIISEWLNKKIKLGPSNLHKIKKNAHFPKNIQNKFFLSASSV